VPLALTAAIAGLGLGLSLIVAIGAQNAFVLRQGLRRERVLVVVAICAASDAILIVVGVGGLGTVIQRAGWALVVVRIAGAAFLTWYGVRSAMRAVKPGALKSDEGGDRMTLAATVTTVLALTWLNPHVYLDTVLLLGSIGGTYGASRWWFALGAALGSVLWFSALGFGSRALRPLFARPVAWRILDAIIAIVMVSIAVSLIVGLFVG
jgi:L-lysine exporter family protein LysE/ArgO